MHPFLVAGQFISACKLLATISTRERFRSAMHPVMTIKFTLADKCKITIGALIFLFHGRSWRAHAVNSLLVPVHFILTGKRPFTHSTFVRFFTWMQGCIFYTKVIFFQISCFSCQGMNFEVDSSKYLLIFLEVNVAIFNKIKRCKV